MAKGPLSTAHTSFRAGDSQLHYVVDPQPLTIFDPLTPEP